MNSAFPGIQSPCIKVCTLDPRVGRCSGCGRTLDEIARWSTMTARERAEIMQGLAARLEQMRTTA